MNKPWYVVHGTFTPTPPSFDNEEEALEYAKSHVSDWEKDVYVVKSETIWRSKDAV